MDPSDCSLQFAAMADADGGSRFDQNPFLVSGASSLKSDPSVAPSSTGAALVDHHAQGEKLADITLRGDEHSARLRRLSASINWNGQADSAAIIRLYFQFVVSETCDTIPLLLDPGAAVVNPNVKLFQHTQFLPEPTSTPAKRDVLMKAQHPRLEGIFKEAYLGSNLACSTLQPTTLSNLLPQLTPPSLTKPFISSYTMGNQPPPPQCDVDLQGTSLAESIEANSNSSALNSALGLHDSSAEVADNQPACNGLEAKSPVSRPPSTPHDSVSTSSSLPCGAIDDHGNDMMNSSMFSTFREAVNTPLGVGRREIREASQESKATVRAPTPTAASNVHSPSLPRGLGDPENQPVRTLERQPSVASDAPTRIPAPVWKEIMTHTVQSPTHSSTHGDTTASQNKVHFFTSQAKNSPQPQPSNTISRSRFSKHRQVMSSSSPVVPRTVTSSKTLRRVSSHQDISPLASRSGKPVVGSHRRRSKSMGGMDGPFVGMDRSETPTTTRSSRGDSGTDRASERSSTTSLSNEGLNAKRGHQALASNSDIDNLNNHASKAGRAEETVSLARDEKGRLCIFRDDGFQPGLYQLDIELAKELSVMNRNNIQTLNLPAVEPSLLRSNHFHDGKMLLHVHGPWSHDNLRIFSHDFFGRNTVNPTFMVGSFKLDSMPVLHVQRRGRVHVYENPSMRLLTEVAISLLSPKEARINYNIQIACEEHGSEIFAEKVVFELTLSNVPVKGKAYVLEPGTSHLQLELLSPSDDYSPSSHQALITVFRDSRDLGKKLCLRFSLFLPLARQAEILVPEVRFTLGTVEAEITNVIEPPYFWVTEPTSPAGGDSWRLSRLLETKQKGLCFTRRKVPVSSTSSSTPIDRVRLRELRWPEFPPVGKIERVSTVMAHGLCYKVFPDAETVRCELEVQVQRLSRPDVVTIFSRGWELLYAFLDGEQVMATLPRKPFRRASESSNGLKSDDVVIRRLSAECQKKQDRWHFRKETRTPSQCHIKMAFGLSGDALEHVFPHALGFGLLPLPKLLGAWIVNASVESGLDNGMRFPDLESNNVFLMPIAASVVYRRYVTTSTDHVEAKLPLRAPFTLQTLDPAHEICIQCFNPMSEMGDSFVSSRKLMTTAQLPSNPPSPVFLPTLRPVSELDTQSSTCSSLPGDDFSYKASAGTLGSPAQQLKTIAVRSHPSAALRQRAKRVPAPEAKDHKPTRAGDDGEGTAAKTASDQRNSLKTHQSTGKSPITIGKSIGQSETRPTARPVWLRTVTWPRVVMVFALAILLFLVMETPVVLPDLHPVRTGLRSMFAPPAHFLTSSEEPCTGNSVVYGLSSSHAQAAGNAESTREPSSEFDRGAAPVTPSEPSLFSENGTTAGLTAPAEESVASLLRRYDQGEDDEHLQRDIRALYRVAPAEALSADEGAEEGKGHGKHGDGEGTVWFGTEMGLLDKFDRALGWKPPGEE